MKSEDDHQFEVLDSLINAPSSVAGIYGDLVWLRRYDRRSIVQALESALSGLEARGWVAVAHVSAKGVFEPLTVAARTACWEEYRKWLPSAERDDLALDEVGVWYRVTDAGQAAWRGWSSEAATGQWQLDHDVQARSVTVEAVTAQMADEILDRWLVENRASALRRQRKEISRVALRSGATIGNGVRIECTYRVPNDSNGGDG